MLLAIDARNRAVSIGFREGGQGWLLRRRLGCVPGRSSDEYALLLSRFAEEAGEGRRVDACWMSSVVPALAVELGRAVSSAFGVAAIAVGPGTKTGVRIRTDVPSEVGSDLVCAAAAAHELAGCPCVVALFDVAIAFAAIGRTGDFLGAAIAPGLGAAAEALRSGAALIPGAVTGWIPASPGEGRLPAIGKNTGQALRSGLAIGYAGLVERLARKQSEELVAQGEAGSTEEVRFLGSGDEAGREILASIGSGSFVPDLVLEGLSLIASRSAPTRPLAC